MLGSGKSSGVINEATNLHTNELITDAIKYMGTAAYQKTRDPGDVIPTHQRQAAEGPARQFKNGVVVYDPEREKQEARLEAQVDVEGASCVVDDDADLSFLREARLQAMKKQQGKIAEWRAKGHGSYREIGQDEFFSHVVREKGGSEMVAVHFYHKDFERCKIMDRHLGDLAVTWLDVKFISINVEKCPFLAEKLRITTLPCVLLFLNDVAVDRIIGFSDLGGDEFQTATLKRRIEIGLRLAESE